MSQGSVAAPDAPAEPTSPLPRPWRRAALTGLGLWLANHLLLLTVRFMAAIFGVKLSAGAMSWLQWDALNYLDIAAYGYPTERTIPYWYPGTSPPDGYVTGGEYPAWFPLYPLVTRVVDVILPGGTAIAALVVSELAALGLYIVLYRLLATEFADELAERTLFFIAAFPTTFFLFVGYNESLFLLLAVGALYLARREQWWLAGTLGALASATRPVGVLLVVALGYEYLRQRGFDRRRVRADVLSLALVPLGLLVYMAYLWRHLGDPWAFAHAQGFWGRAFRPPWDSFAMAIHEAVNAGPRDEDLVVYNLIDVASAVLALTLLVLCVVGRWKLRRDQIYLVIFGAAPLLLALCTPMIGDPFPMASTNRFVIETLPAFVVLARMAANRTLERAYLMLVIPAQAVFLLLYLRGQWAG